MKPKLERLVQVLWIVALAGPLPIVMSPIYTDLQQIQAMPVYLFSILIWLVALLALGVLVFSRWNRVTRFPDTVLSRLLFAAGIACYLVSVFSSSVSIAIAGWTLLSGAWLSTHMDSMGSGSTVNSSKDSTNGGLMSYWPAVGMLLQVPDFLEARVFLTYKQLLAAVVGSFLDVLRIPFRNDKLTFELAHHTLSIDDTLANSPSIVCVMFISCVIVAWLRRPLVLLPVYLSIAVFWTFGSHLVQLAVIAIARQRFGIDFSTVWPSIALTFATLVVAAGLFLSSDRLLRILFMPVPLEDSPRGALNPIVSVWNGLLFALTVDHGRRV